MPREGKRKGGMEGWRDGGNRFLCAENREKSKQHGAVG